MSIQAAMTPNDSSIWGASEVLAPRVLDASAVSFSSISDQLSILFTGLLADVQQESGCNVAAAAVYLRLPILVPEGMSIRVRGDLRGSFDSSGTASARVYVLIGLASQAFDLQAGSGEWTRDFTVGLTDRGETICTLMLVAMRGSPDEISRLEVDSLDLVAQLERVPVGADVLY